MSFLTLDRAEISFIKKFQSLPGLKAPSFHSFDLSIQISLAALSECSFCVPQWMCVQCRGLGTDPSVPSRVCESRAGVGRHSCALGHCSPRLWFPCGCSQARHTLARGTALLRTLLGTWRWRGPRLPAGFTLLLPCFCEARAC